MRYLDGLIEELKQYEDMDRKSADGGDGDDDGDGDGKGPTDLHKMKKIYNTSQNSCI